MPDENIGVAQGKHIYTPAPEDPTLFGHSKHRKQITYLAKSINGLPANTKPSLKTIIQTNCGSKASWTDTTFETSGCLFLIGTADSILGLVAY